MSTMEHFAQSSSAASRVWRFLSHRRIHISLIVVCLLIGDDMLRGVRPHSVVDFSDTWSVIGVLLVVSGVLMRGWAAGVLHKNALLSTNGPYSFTRNPLYLGSFLMMIGFCTLIGALHNYVAMLLLALTLYVPKIKGEENLLQRKFGPAWTDYVHQTPRLLPRHFSLRAMRSEWSWAQWRLNKEYMALLGVALGLVVFEIWFRLNP
jgi:protein-S-isoprenylcysteine O-methyltransferase Ste14